MSSLVVSAFVGAGVKVPVVVMVVITHRSLTVMYTTLDTIASAIKSITSVVALL